MPQVRNTNVDALLIEHGGISRRVDPGDTVDVAEEDLERFVLQEGNWAPVGAQARKETKKIETEAASAASEGGN